MYQPYLSYSSYPDSDALFGFSLLSQHRTWIFMVVHSYRPSGRQDGLQPVGLKLAGCEVTKQTGHLSCPTRSTLLKDRDLPHPRAMC